MIDVETGGQPLAEEIRLGERRLPALAVLAVRNAQAHILAAAEEVRLGIGELGHDALSRRIAAAEADRAGRLVLDVDDDDHAVRRRARAVRDVDLLEVAETVQTAFGPLDQRMVVGVAFADIELAADDVVAGACVADDVDPLDIDLGAVIHGVLQRDGMVVGVALAVRPDFGEGVALARDVAAHGVDRLVHPSGVVDVAGLEVGVLEERRTAHLRDVRIDRHARHVVLRAFVHGDRDHVAGGIVLIDDVGIGDAEVGVAVLHVVAADGLLVGGEPVGIVHVGALEPRQEVHGARLHQVVQTVARDRIVADEANLANSGLVPLVDGEDEIDPTVGQLNQPLGHRSRIAAVLLVGILDAADVAFRRRLIIGRARLRLHFDFELVLLDVPVALEDDAIDDLRPRAEGHDDLAVNRLCADRGIDSRRLEVVDAALDGCRVRPGEVRLEGRGVDAGLALDDDLLSERRRRGSERPESKNDRQNKSAEEAANPTHVAHSPSSHTSRRNRLCAPA